MGVDCNPRGLTEGLSKHHLCGLPTDPREADQLIQITGNYFSKFGGDSTSCFPKILGLGSMQSCGSDHCLELSLRRRRHIRRSGPPIEDRRRHLIHSLIGALCREYRGDEQFPRRPIVELTDRVGIGLCQPFDHQLNTLPAHLNDRKYCRR